MATKRLDLPSFKAELSRNPAIAASLPQPTMWRYSNGVVPKSFHWLLQHPALLRALAEDAERQQSATTPAAEPSA